MSCGNLSKEDPTKKTKSHSRKLCVETITIKTDYLNNLTCVFAFPSKYFDEILSRKFSIDYLITNKCALKEMGATRSTIENKKWSIEISCGCSLHLNKPTSLIIKKNVKSLHKKEEKSCKISTWHEFICHR